MVSGKRFSFFVPYNHLFSNQTLHECETSLFQWEIRTRCKGFLCQLGICYGIVWRIRVGLLESKTPPCMGFDVSSAAIRRSLAHCRNQPQLFRAGIVAFHCLGGRPLGRIYGYWLCPRIKKISQRCLLHIRQQNGAWSCFRERGYTST